MKIDIHRHAKDQAGAGRVLRNLFPEQLQEIEDEGYYSVGLHPWMVKEARLHSDLKCVAKAAQNSQVLAIGEAGIDKIKEVPLRLQEKAFRSQIELAMELNKPMVLHCVKAYNEVQQLRKEYQPHQPWLVHWFYASPQMAHEMVRQGFLMSFGLTLFHEKSKACRAFKELPLSKVFLETDDAEYSIEAVYEQAAQLRGIGMKELEQQMEENFNTVFLR